MLRRLSQSHTSFIRQTVQSETATLTRAVRWPFFVGYFRFYFFSTRFGYLFLYYASFRVGTVFMTSLTTSSVHFESVDQSPDLSSASVTFTHTHTLTYSQANFEISCDYCAISDSVCVVDVWPIDYDIQHPICAWKTRSFLIFFVSPTMTRGYLLSTHLFFYQTFFFLFNVSRGRISNC